MPIPVIAVFDIGKTNKKLCVFNEDYEIIFENAVQLDEIKDEDGEPCEDIEKLSNWVKQTVIKLFQSEKFTVRAINFSAYGASLVYIDEEGKVLTPLYNYLKKYPAQLKSDFYSQYGGEENICLETASPSLESLNSGLQLYRLKYEQPGVFKQVKYALHLPQFVSYLVTGKSFSDITSIGCHTALWNFRKQDYHEWVVKEGLVHLMAPLVSSTTGNYFDSNGDEHVAGVGLHDSSAALIPYLVSFREPFVLISTGTWSISLNPFNHSALTIEELRKDCLCNLSFEAKPVKTSRLFAGYEHDQQVKRLNAHFNKPSGYYRSISFNPVITAQLRRTLAGSPRFGERDLSVFGDYATAYHQLIIELMAQQQESTQLVLNNTSVKRIFVDGGFSQNAVYMHLLADAFPDYEVYAASIPQASALGAALAIHQHWNLANDPKELVELKHYPAAKNTVAG
jgi:sugar (pentulose or hexulose) kinase